MAGMILALRITRLLLTGNGAHGRRHWGESIVEHAREIHSGVANSG